MEANQKLFEALESEDSEAFAAALAEGADVNAKNADGKTPLLLAAEGQLLDYMKELLARRADPNTPDDDGQTPVQAATVGTAFSKVPDKLAAVRLIVEAGGNPKIVTAEGDSLLNLAAGQRAKGDDKAVAEWVSYLVSLGLDANHKGADAVPPLRTAVARQDAAMTKALLAAGAAPSLRDDEGQTPLHIARKLVSAEPLVAAGADLDAVDSEGNTALHLRVEGDLAVARLLIDHGARKDLRNQAGQLPFDLARSEEWEELLKVPGVKTRREWVADWARQIEASPSEPGPLLERGDLLVALGDREAAAADYRRAAELDPRLARAHRSLAGTLAELDRHDEAVAAYGAAIALDAKDVKARVGRAVLNDRLRRFAAVVEDCQAAAQLTLDDEQQEVVRELAAKAAMEQELATMTPIQIVESWYRVTLPAVYRDFLEQQTYAKYPRHRPGRLPTYSLTPQVHFIVGRDVFGMEEGAGHLSPSLARQEAEMLQTEADAARVSGVGDYIKKQVFSGLELDSLEPGELDQYIPFALLKNDSQTLALHLGGGGCAVKMFDHESCKFYPVTDSIPAFLEALKDVDDKSPPPPLPDEDEDEDGDSDSDSDD